MNGINLNWCDRPENAATLKASRGFAGCSATGVCGARCESKFGRPSLSVIMNRYGTDKLWAHHYDGEYARHFEPLRNRPIKLLEIGIGGYNAPGRGGESLKVWRDYFPSGIIHGIDIEDKSFLDGDRLHTHKGSQSDVAFLESIAKSDDPDYQFDIIIDDGSHVQSDILTSFSTLFPLLKAGGIYVIEDLETSYRADHGGEQCPLRWPESMTTITLIEGLIDGLHWKFWRGRAATEIQRAVKSVHVSHELVFIYKHE